MRKPFLALVGLLSWLALGIQIGHGQIVGSTLPITDDLDRASLRLAGSGIEVRFHDFRCIEYEQLHGPFLSHLSVADALMCLGADGAREVMLAGRIEEGAGAAL